MTKKIFLTLVSAFFLVSMLVGCGTKESKNENTDNDSAENQETSDNDISDVEQAGDTGHTDEDSDSSEIEDKKDCISGNHAGRGGDRCYYTVGSRDGYRHAGFYHECETDCDDWHPDCHIDFMVKEINQDSDNVTVKGVCLDKNGNETGSDAAFWYEKYQSDPLLPDSLVGKVMHGFTIKNSTGYSSFDMLRNETGELIFLNNTGLNGLEDVKKAAVELKVEQKIISTCESVCIKENVCCQEPCDEEPNYDYFYFPPIEFTFEGREPVLVAIGEHVEREGIEYYVYFSQTVAPEDSDQLFFSNSCNEMPADVNSRAEFYIFNINALK